MTRGLPQAPVSGIGWKWRGTESRSSSRSVRAPPQTTARQNTAITRLQRVSDLAGHANLLVQLPGWSFGARSQRSGCIAERAAVVSLRDGPAVPAVDAVSMEPLVGELGRAPSLLCPLALVGDAGRKERDVAKLLAVAFRAGEGHRPSIRSTYMRKASFREPHLPHPSVISRSSPGSSSSPMRTQNSPSAGPDLRGATVGPLGRGAQKRSRPSI